MHTSSFADARFPQALAAIALARKEESVERVYVVQVGTGVPLTCSSP